MAYEWHALKATSNLKKHGVSFEEAETVLENLLTDVQPDFKHSVGEARFLAIGMSAQGRVLVVSFSERAGAIRIISAREATRRERKDYESQSDFTG